MDDGSVKGAIASQLSNSLKQAEQQYDKGSMDKAADFIDKFLSQLEKRSDKDKVSDDAVKNLTSTAKLLLQQWS
ncbi:hypothetical protein AB4Y93_26960 [Paenibacillus sp. YAF4_2]